MAFCVAVSLLLLFVAFHPDEQVCALLIISNE